MRVLCVAEKPSIAKSIAQILSGGGSTTRNTSSKFIKNYDFDYPQTRSQYTVTAVVGHLMNQDFGSMFKSWNSCDPFSLFDASIEVTVAADKKDVEKNLQQEARRAQTLMIWTDCDREGEHIGYEIVTVCRRANPRMAVKRARFSAIIAQQIHNAAQHPVELDMNQVHSVEARIALDLRIGAAFTRLQTLALQSKFGILKDNVVSYGPCQFPTLGFVVARFNQVQAFRPETFWYIYLAIKKREGREPAKEVVFSWDRGHLFDQDVALLLYQCALARQRGVIVTKVTTKNTEKWKPLPLTTVELQKSGSRLLKLAPKKILDIAEKLYQQGFLSYPRTETDKFDPQFNFMSLIEKQTADPAWGGFARDLHQGAFQRPRNGRNDDHAHPPIHPTAYAGNLTGDDKRVYEYIARRFLACCSKNALGYQTRVEVDYGGEEFHATGLIVLERNYLEVYPYDKWNDNELPNFAEGEEYEPSVVELRDGETTKPNLLTEADLVSLMDKNGIGTDATIAQHIETIITRGYVIERMEGKTKYLVPSSLGIGLIEGYDKIEFEKSLSKPQLRRETERNMVQVCEGAKSKGVMLEEAIVQYKDIFMRAKNGFNNVITCVQHRLEPPQGGNDRGGGPGRGRGRGARGGRGGGGPDGGPGAGGRGGGGTDDEDLDGGPGHGGGRGRGRGTGRGRGGAPPPPPPPRPLTPPEDLLDEDFFFDDDPPPPPPKHPEPPPKRNPAQNTTKAAAPPKLTKTAATTSSTSTTTKPAVRQPPPAPVPSGSTVPYCDCGFPALETSIILARGPACKQWGCGNLGRCEFFQVDKNPIPLIPQKRPSSEYNPGAKKVANLLCHCNNIARLSETGTGRKFWGCPDEKCNFMEWVTNTAAQPLTDPMEPSSYVGTVGRSREADVCFKCNQTGHWASGCPNAAGPSEPKRTKSSASGGQTGACYRCGQDGHWANACPDSGGGASKPKSRTTSRTTSTSKRGAKTTRTASGSSTRGKSTKGKKTASKFAAADEF